MVSKLSKCAAGDLRLEIRSMMRVKPSSDFVVRGVQGNIAGEVNFVEAGSVFHDNGIAIGLTYKSVYFSMAVLPYMTICGRGSVAE